MDCFLLLEQLNVIYRYTIILDSCSRRFCSLFCEQKSRFLRNSFILLHPFVSLYSFASLNWLNWSEKKLVLQFIFMTLFRLIAGRNFLFLSMMALSLLRITMGTSHSQTFKKLQAQCKKKAKVKFAKVRINKCFKLWILCQSIMRFFFVL